MIEKEKIHVDVNGVWFNGKHSWRDFGLFLADRPDTGTPAPKTVFVDVPGSNGSLDYTEAATGYVTYENRQMTFTFSAMVAAEEQQKFISRFRNAIHGRNVEVELDEDSGWVYNGRAEVAVESAEDWKLKLAVTVNAYPYKLSKSFRTVRLNLPGLTTPWGEENTPCKWTLTPEVSAYGGYQTYFRLTRTYIPPNVPWSSQCLNLGAFGGMELEWDAEETPYAIATAYLETLAGTTFDYTFDATTGHVTWLDLSRIFPAGSFGQATSLLIDGIPNCKVSLVERVGYPSTKAKTVIDVGDMPVSPIVHQNCQQGFEVWCNSSYALTVVRQTGEPGLVPVPYPPMPNLVLLPGENEVVVAWRLPENESGTTEGKFLDFTFREGRL